MPDLARRKIGPRQNNDDPLNEKCTRQITAVAVTMNLANDQFSPQERAKTGKMFFAPWLRGGPDLLSSRRL